MNKEIKVWNAWQNPTELQADSATDEWVLNTVDENGSAWKTTFLGSKMMLSVQV